MRALMEWGLVGAKALAAEAAVLIVVDVLSFSTAVDVATARGAAVIPFPSDDRTSAAAAADAAGAALAGRRTDPAARFTLSPASLEDIPAGARLLLPSPNGSTISAAAPALPTLAGCLRNATAVALRAAALSRGGPVAVIPAGERWPDGSLRPAVEDLLGAGAILAALGGAPTPEAAAAVAAFRAAAGDLADALGRSVSGRELAGRGFQADVDIAARLDASDAAPLLTEGVYRA